MVSVLIDLDKCKLDIERIQICIIQNFYIFLPHKSISRNNVKKLNKIDLFIDNLEEVGDDKY